MCFFGEPQFEKLSGRNLLLQLLPFQWNSNPLTVISIAPRGIKFNNSCCKKNNVYFCTFFTNRKNCVTMKHNMTQIKGERMDKNVYAAIQSQYATFSKVGKRIADHIIADPVHITSISIQQMAAELGIAESSIIRFCKILGCAGFSEMKLLLAKYSPKSVRTIFEDLSETDSIQTISESVFGRNIDTLERALQLLDFQKIEQAVDVLSRAENILILGVGASGTIAEDFYIRLMRIGFRAVSLTDSHLMQIQASLCMPNTAVIAISHTGKTREIVSAVRTAKEHGAQTIGITGFPDTPLKASSDLCLELYSPEQLFVSPRVAQFSLIDSLYVSLAIRQKDRVVRNIEQVNEALRPLRME